MATVGKKRIAKSIIIKLLILVVLLAIGIIFNAPSMHHINPFQKDAKVSTELPIQDE